MLGELLGADCESDGEHGGHGDGNATDQKDKDVVETATVRVVERRVEEDDFEEENSDGDQAEGPDLSENILQVAGAVVVLSDERGSATEERLSAFSTGILAASVPIREAQAFSLVTRCLQGVNGVRWEHNWCVTMEEKLVAIEQTSG